MTRARHIAVVSAVLPAVAIGWLAAGCSTAPSERNAEALAPADAGLAESLAHYSQALILSDGDGFNTQAVAQLEQAVRDDPTRLSLHGVLAAWYVRNGESNKAVRILEDAWAAMPCEPAPRVLLGEVCETLGDTNRAIREYRAAAALAPSLPLPHLKLSALLVASGDLRGAIRAAARGLERADEPDILLQYLELLADHALLSRRYGDALFCLRLIGRHLPGNPAVRESIARVHAAAGRTRTALAMLEELSAQSPTNIAVQYQLGDLYEEVGDTNRAAACFQRVVDASPRFGDAYVRLAGIYMRADLSAAADVLRVGLRRIPDEPLLNAFLGVVLSHDRKFPEAMAAFARAEAAAQGDGEGARPLPAAFYFWSGAAHEQAGQFDAAVALLEKSIALHPQIIEPYNYLAYMWADKGVNLDKAMEYVNHALKARPDDAAYIDTLGWICFRKGDFPAALRHLRRAESLMPDDPTITDHVGDAWLAAGKPAAAIASWKRSLTLEPSNEKVAAKLRAHGVSVPQSSPQPQHPAAP